MRDPHDELEFDGFDTGTDSLEFDDTESGFVFEPDADEMADSDAFDDPPSQ